MNNNPFETLNFEQPSRIRISARTQWVLAVSLCYLVFGWLMPPGLFFWLVFVLLVANAWVASYGWREAIKHISNFIQRLERL